MKRILLFVLTNILVVFTISIALKLLGVQPYLNANGINYEALLIFCLVWGMGGAFISLAMSRMAAKWMMGVKVIDPQSPGQFAWLVSSVHTMSKAAGLPALPEVGVYESHEVNAFATGPTKSRALVAVSTGLLERMDRREIDGVLGHEVAHIANGDMVTMTLIQGIVNAFAMFAARVLGFFAGQAVKEEQAALVRFLVTIVCEILLTFCGAMVVAWFSRQREFRADRGGANLAGRDGMIAALQKLQRLYSPDAIDNSHQSLAAMKISGKQGGLMALFSTHPPLETRIAALQGYSA